MPSDDLTPSERELLIRLDERTERLDRDVRTMMNGQTARADALVAKIDDLGQEVKDEVTSLRAVVGSAEKRADEALSLAKETREWITWTVRIVLTAVIMAVLVTAGIVAG